MSAYRAFKSDLKKFLSLDGKFHRELVHHFLGISVDDKSYCLLGGNASLVAVEYLVFVDF